MASTDRPPALVFGGTFDPPHVAHVAVASAATTAIAARSLLVVPAALNPQRAGSHPPASAADRLAMVRLAFRAETRAKILDVEIVRGGPSYTIDTLRALEAEGESPLRLLVGSDQALNLPSWRDWREVVRLAPPAIVVRPPHTRRTLEEALRASYGSDAPLWIDRILPLPPVDLSATSVRAELLNGLANGLASGLERGGLDPEVFRYIREHRLYGTS
jgi:nicotinate-nucleotide adenylyltransferase